LPRPVTSGKEKPSLLERFGLYYLDFFGQIESTHNVFDIPDEQLGKKVNRITRKGVILSSLIGITCVFPIVWADHYYQNAGWWIHYGWVVIISFFSIIIELYVLFIIALKAVHEVSEIINLHASEKELGNEGLFSVKHILARAALELPDPELTILGIDPFKRISKKNLFVLGLLYKAKIFVTNFILKNSLLFMAGKEIFGIPVLYEAVPVECFWNSIVIRRVVHEARLRLFGFALANQIAGVVIKDKILDQLSPLARIGCMRAVGNAVVMAQNYHPNMIILLLRFQQILQITSGDKYDDWDMFLKTLEMVSRKERFFLLDLFTVSAAFDGKISRLETENLQAAYKDDFELYFPRLDQLTLCLQEGRLNAALSLCRLDFVAG
jgi:hypothetical protein